MKKSFFLLLLTGFTFVFAYSQDKIVKNNGDIILCKIQSQDSVSVYFTLTKNGRDIDTFIKMSQVRYVSYGEQEEVFTNEPVDEIIKNGPLDKVSLGLGLGMDFGGIGGNLLFYPQRNIGIFGGLGFAYAGTGYNVGIKLRTASSDSTARVVPYGLLMYGYNAAIVVTNATDLNKIFYGPSLGFGLDYKSHLSKKSYWTIALIIPIRGSEVDDYMEDLKDNHGVEFKNDLLPVSFTIGYRIILK